MPLDRFMAKVDELTNQGDNAEALALANRMVEEFPEDVRAWSARGHVYACNKDFPSAVGDLTRAIRLNKMEPSLFFDRGRYALALGTYKSAADDFSIGLQLCDHYANDYYRESFHFMRAEAFLRLGKKSEALADLAHVRDDLKAWTCQLRTKAELLEELRNLPG